MPNLRPFVLLLFVPAGLGITLRVALAQALPERLLALALLLLCLELAHMAQVDFDNISSVTASHLLNQLPNQPSTQSHDQILESEDSRVASFRKVVDSTVVLELLGFYGAVLFLQWGGIVIVFSQLWFNLLAKIQLWPSQTPMVTSCERLARLPVLVANAVALVLIALWFVQEMRLWLATALLILVCLFLVIKYAVPIFCSVVEQKTAKPSEDGISDD